MSRQVYNTQLRAEMFRRQQQDREPPSFFGPLLWSVVLAFVFLFLFSPFLTIIAIGDWLYNADAFRRSVADLPLGAGGWLIPGATLVLLVIITVARRRRARRWLEDRTSPPAVLTRVVVGWSFLRSLVLLAGAGVSWAALGVFLLPPPDPTQDTPSQWDGTLLDPLAFDRPILIGMVISAILLVTVLSSVLPLRRYTGRAARQLDAEAEASRIAAAQPPPVVQLPPPPGAGGAPPPPPPGRMAAPPPAGPGGPPP